MEVLHETDQDLQALDLKDEFGDCLPPVQNDVTPAPDFSGGGREKRENTEIWLGPGDVITGGDVDGDHSLFYAADDFPPLPEFPCMSSSSSNSSTPAPSTAPTTATAGGFSSSGATPVCSSSSSSSSSSAASWAVLKSDAEASDEYHHHHHHHQSVQPDQQKSDHHRYDDRSEGIELREMDEMDVVADCINVMEDFDCMGINQLIEDSNEIWDPTPLFESTDQIPQNPFEQFQQQIGEFGVSPEAELHPPDRTRDQSDDQQFLFLDDQTPTTDGDQDKTVAEDLAVVFFEWLKSNKEAISAEELRSIKIKKSTIESAARRLGGGKEGMKQLLKLILQWVQHHRLQNKRSQGESALSDLPDPNPNPIQHEQLSGFNLQPPPWINPYVTDPSAAAIAAAPAPPPPAGPGFASMMSYIGGHDHHPYGAAHQPYSHALLPPDQYHMLDSSMSAPWAGQLAPHPASFATLPPPPAPMHYKAGPDGCLLQAMAPQGFAGYGNQYNPYQFFPAPGDGLVRNMGSSATKEARKKRMARQRRLFTHHHRGHDNTSQHHGNGVQHQMTQGGGLDPNGRLMIGDHDSTGSISHGGWVYWPPAAGVAAPPMMGSMQLPLQQLQPQQQVAAERPGVALSQGSQRQAAADKKQGFKTEKNLKFLLQKVLKQSDVGSLGRIVLPKKEAETHLPELEARDGIPIAMEDIGTSRVWNMRYRFWPNNKSRMYLLENTGDFVRSNGLQEGDFIVIYSDVKCGKYMIRGVKVRPQQQGSKSETKKPSNKALKTQSSGSPAGSSALSPLTQRQ